MPIAMGRVNERQSGRGREREKFTAWNCITEFVENKTIIQYSSQSGLLRKLCYTQTLPWSVLSVFRARFAW